MVPHPNIISIFSVISDLKGFSLDNTITITFFFCGTSFREQNLYMASQLMIELHVDYTLKIYVVEQTKQERLD